jgi:hypothetical protein
LIDLNLNLICTDRMLGNMYGNGWYRGGAMPEEMWSQIRISDIWVGWLKHALKYILAEQVGKLDLNPTFWI